MNGRVSLVCIVYTYVRLPGVGINVCVCNGQKDRKISVGVGKIDVAPPPLEVAICIVVSFSLGPNQAVFSIKRKRKRTGEQTFIQFNNLKFVVKKYVLLFYNALLSKLTCDFGIVY